MWFTSGIVPDQLPAAVVRTRVFIVPDAVTFLWREHTAQPAAIPHTQGLKSSLIHQTTLPGAGKVPFCLPLKVIFFFKPVLV